MPMLVPEIGSGTQFQKPRSENKSESNFDSHRQPAGGNQQGLSEDELIARQQLVYWLLEDEQALAWVKVQVARIERFHEMFGAWDSQQPGLPEPLVSMEKATERRAVKSAMRCIVDAEFVDDDNEDKLIAEEKSS